jgi:hypothetical protein
MAGHSAADPLDFTSLIRSGRTVHGTAVDPGRRRRVARQARGPVGLPASRRPRHRAQISLGEVSVESCQPLQPGFLTHMHFCQAGSETTLSPLTYSVAVHPVESTT